MVAGVFSMTINYVINEETTVKSIVGGDLGTDAVPALG